MACRVPSQVPQRQAFGRTPCGIAKFPVELLQMIFDVLTAAEEMKPYHLNAVCNPVARDRPRVRRRDKTLHSNGACARQASAEGGRVTVMASLFRANSQRYLTCFNIWYCGTGEHRPRCVLCTTLSADHPLARGFAASVQAGRRYRLPCNTCW